MGDREAVIAANAEFYEAFNEADFFRMDGLWARQLPVAVIHPGWPALFGREDVVESWRRIFEGGAPGEVLFETHHVMLLGESALVIGYEHLPDGSLAITNVFAREEDGWKMVHHQAGPAPETYEEPEGPLH